MATVYRLDVTNIRGVVKRRMFNESEDRLVKGDKGWISGEENPWVNPKRVKANPAAGKYGKFKTDRERVAENQKRDSRFK